MILEVAILNVNTGEEAEFEQAFIEAQQIISKMEGYISHQLQRSIENSSKYILLVEWRSLEDHEIGFRGSKDYQEWRRLLHHFYNPFPEVEHYSPLFNGRAE